MRQLKFRAWDGEKMISPDYISRDGLAYWRENSVIETSDNVMQFTGLKDKNGVEIYEGDKVRFIAIEDARKSHKTESTGVVEWDDEDAGFYILNDSDKFPHVKFWYAEEIEVIGNIYQS